MGRNANLKVQGCRAVNSTCMSKVQWAKANGIARALREQNTENKKKQLTKVSELKDEQCWIEMDTDPEDKPVEDANPTGSSEENKVRMLSNPKMPSREEQERHAMTHVPFRSCAKCAWKLKLGTAFTE